MNFSFFIYFDYYFIVYFFEKIFYNKKLGFYEKKVFRT